MILNHLGLTGLILPFWLGLTIASQAQSRLINNNKPDDPLLYATIVKLDSLFFDAYNTCLLNLDTYSSFYSDSIEFYHDQGGLSHSKAAIIAATKNNICGKVTRELVKEASRYIP